MKGKNSFTLIILMLAGIVLGGFLGSLCTGVGALKWLNYGQSFGMSSPLVLDLGVLVFTFGINIKITVAGIIGMVAAIFISKKI